MCVFIDVLCVFVDVLCLLKVNNDNNEDISSNTSWSIYKREWINFNRGKPKAQVKNLCGDSDEDGHDDDESPVRKVQKVAVKNLCSDSEDDGYDNDGPDEYVEDDFCVMDKAAVENLSEEWRPSQATDELADDDAVEDADLEGDDDLENDDDVEDDDDDWRKEYFPDDDFEDETEIKQEKQK